MYPINFGLYQLPGITKWGGVVILDRFVKVCIYKKKHFYLKIKIIFMKISFYAHICALFIIDISTIQ
jgi:hypothetical protein